MVESKGILGGCCGAGSGVNEPVAWRGGSFGERLASAMGPREAYDRPRGAGQNRMGRAGRAPYDRMYAELGVVDLSLHGNATVDVLGNEPGDVGLGGWTRADCRS